MATHLSHIDQVTCLWQLHEQVKEGEPEVVNEAAGYLLPSLLSCVRHFHPRISADFIVTATVDALLDYIRRPQTFDPAKCVPLDRFLVRAASRNLSNLLRAEIRRQKRECQFATHNTPQKAIPPFDVGASETDIGSNETRLLASLFDVAQTEREKDALECWLRGERRTSEFAAVLRVSHLSLIDQRRHVKQFKDRIIKRVRRRDELARG